MELCICGSDQRSERCNYSCKCIISTKVDFTSQIIPKLETCYFCNTWIILHGINSISHFSGLPQKEYFFLKIFCLVTQRIWTIPLFSWQVRFFKLFNFWILFYYRVFGNILCLLKDGAQCLWILRENKPNWRIFMVIL